MKDKGKMLKNYYITSGSGKSQYKLVAFDKALIEAGISNYNLVRVSSILPASCFRRDNIDVEFGSPLHTAYAVAYSDKQGEKIATAVAVGIPKSNSDIGIIMEAVGTSAIETEETAKNMVIEAMDNHGIILDHIEASSTEAVVERGFISLVSAVSLW